MAPDWNSIRLESIDFDEPMRATLRTMRPWLAKFLPGILARFYDKVRHYDTNFGLFKNGLMQEAIRRQLLHWDLIAACDFGPAYVSSIAEFCNLHQRAGVVPHWYVGCRQMFVADQLIKAVEADVAVPRFGAAARAAREKRSSMKNAIAKANMFDTEQFVAAYFGINRQLRKDAISAANDRFRTIITALSTASGELESTARSLSDNANNRTRLASVVASASGDASSNVRSVAVSTEELAGSVREISMQVQESNRIAASAVRQANDTDQRINALSQAASRIGDVIKLITSVAEQTNLLALNATIEAARAGEAVVVSPWSRRRSRRWPRRPPRPRTKSGSRLRACRPDGGSGRLDQIDQFDHRQDFRDFRGDFIGDRAAGRRNPEISANIQRTSAGTSQSPTPFQRSAACQPDRRAASSASVRRCRSNCLNSTARLAGQIDGFLQSIAAAA